MIQLADHTLKQQVWDMWKTCFGDPDNYMELYFRDKYHPDNTLLYMEGHKAVASLQMLDYRFTFHGIEVPVIYLSGVCTLPEYRKKGYTRALLIEGFHEAIRRGVPLMFLVPQEKWLMELYAKYGFAQTFDPGAKELPNLRQLLSRYPEDLQGAYREFDRHYRRQDMTVQKTFDDFKTIVEEGALFDFPAKKKLIGMARVIDAGHLLSLYVSQQNKNTAFNMTVRDDLLPRNNLTISVSETAGFKASQNALSGQFGDALKKEAGDKALSGIPNINVDISNLAQLLLGYHTTAKGEPYTTLFPEKSPGMHFMLE